ncbi:TetR family transcriptional regulator [Rugosimonospora africana]|uniref:TetR family transcriptional regulator n=2 Tax=Rugosimonospora africana TaxID=556532 RepID=A0A8J3QXX6_9ACTN|nr:TetR family transcriptional regulator [Rugosimonospora africana]
MLDEEGLEGLSMRRLGARLEAGATSVYWYVANKDELLDLAMDEVLAEITIPDLTGDWRADLYALVKGLRAMMFAHPWALQVYNNRPVFGPHAREYAEAQLRLLRSAGFVGDDLDGAFHMIVDYVRGSVTIDPPRPVRRPRRHSDGEQRMTLNDSTPDVVAPYPALREYREHALTHDRSLLLQRRFDFGLRVLLEGLARRLDNAKHP